MKNLLFIFLFPFHLIAQELPSSVNFWNTLKEHFGKSYEGEIIAGGKIDDGFTVKKLVMHIRSCEDKMIRIPFFVGEDKSRTWVFTLSDGELIKLKHDHRHKDGSEDKITQYGGTSSNTGLTNIQFFPADQETSNLIPTASTNLWWVTIDKTSFTYNLRRLETDRYFSVKFDLTKEVTTPGDPCGSID